MKERAARSRGTPFCEFVAVACFAARARPPDFPTDVPEKIDYNNKSWPATSPTRRESIHFFPAWDDFFGETGAPETMGESGDGVDA